MAAHLGSLGTWRWTQACCGDSVEMGSQLRCTPPAPVPAAGLFPGMSGWEQGTKGKWHTLARPPPPDTYTGFRCPLPAARSTNLPSWVLLFRCWCFVSHITDVTSPRHQSSAMDLMSLCFLQLRKTSKRLSLQHPEEPAGRSATVSVFTGGWRTAKGQKGPAGWLRASETYGQHPGHSRSPLSSAEPATCHPSHRKAGEPLLCLALL